MTHSDSEERAEANPRAYTPEETRHGMRWLIIGWVFGAAFSSMVNTAFTPFLKQVLKVSDLALGIISAAGPAAVLFLFFGALVTERTGRTKRLCLIFTYPYRLSWLGIAAIPLVFGNFPNAWATGALGLIMFFGSAAANFGGAGVTAWLAELVPKSSAGSYFAMRATIGMWAMIVTGFIVGKVIDVYKSAPAVYAWVFGIASILGVIDMVCFSRVPERPRPVPEEKPSIWDILRAPWKDKLFRSFSLYSSIAWFTYSMMGVFVVPYCIAGTGENGLGLSVFATVLFVSLIPMLSMAVVTPFWGNAIDRFGPKPVLGVGSLSAALLPFVWLLFHPGGGTTVTVGPWTLHPTVLWLIPLLQVIGGLTWPAVEQGVFYVQIHGFPEEKKSAYIASFSLVIQVASVAGSTIAGTIAGYLAGFWMDRVKGLPVPYWFSHYQVVFLVALLVRLGAFVVLFPRLHLEGTAQYHEVAKAVAQDAKTAVPKLVRRKRGK